MVTKSQKIRLGIFITVSVVAMVLLIGVIVAPQFLEKRDIYYIGYRDVSLTGLQKGGVVKYQGLTVGHVSNISIDPNDIRRVIVEVSLDHGTPIKEDTYAEIAILGITGLKVIELRGGSNEAKPLKPGSFIKPGKSVTEAITGKAEIIAEKTEAILNNIASLTTAENREKMLRLLDNSSRAIEELYDILRKNNRTLTTTLANTEKITTDLQGMVISTRNTMDNLQALTGSDTLKQVISNLAEITNTLKQAELVQLVNELNTALEHTNNMLREVEITFSKSRTDLSYSIAALRESAEYLNQFSRMITEDPSILVRGVQPKNAPDFKLEK